MRIDVTPEGEKEKIENPTVKLKSTFGRRRKGEKSTAQYIIFCQSYWREGEGEKLKSGN